jgi:hypothetical protein
MRLRSAERPDPRENTGMSSQRPSPFDGVAGVVNQHVRLVKLEQSTRIKDGLKC